MRFVTVKLVQAFLNFLIVPEVNGLQSDTIAHLIHALFYFCPCKLKNIEVLNDYGLTFFGGRRSNTYALYVLDVTVLSKVY